MPYNEGAKLDMINEPVPETTFVKDPGTLDIAGLYNSKFVNTVPSDLNSSDDMNDFSLKDLANKTNEYSDKFLDMVGLGKKPENKTIQPINVSQQKETESLLSEVNKAELETKLEDGLSSKINTKALQNYMAEPDADLKSLIGDKKYTGPIDGAKNNEIEELSKYLEASIAKIIGNKDVFGVVMNTHVGDVKAAVKTVVSYKKYLLRSKVENMGLDDRFVELAKFIK